MLTGGYDGTGKALTTAEIYDPNSGGFSATGGMASGRYFHTATLLSTTGKVLVTGGLASVASPLSASELFDPVTGTFTSTADMTTPRYSHTATLLQNGIVLVTGGTDANNQPQRVNCISRAVGSV